MRPLPIRSRGVLVLLAAAVGLAGCGKPGSRSPAGVAPAPASTSPPAGAASVTTRNTTRVGGADAVADAAGVAQAVYPGLTQATRPEAVVLADAREWSSALAASALASAPLGAPLLYAEGSSLPQASAQALAALRPRGSPALGGAQVIRIATTAAVPEGLVTRSLPAAEPAVAAAAIARVLERVTGRPARQVIVLAANAPRGLEMPAAGLAAESGAPILFAGSQRLPAATAALLASLRRPSIYVIGADALGSRTLRALARFGPVTPLTTSAATGEGAVSASIAVARFTDGSFGWGVKEPGHGLVFENAGRPLDAPAAALLSATADYGPVLLCERPAPLPAALSSYLADIQPAYTSAPQFRPVRGVYNHGWLIGDESAISALTQAEIDALLQISPRNPSSEEASVTPVE